MYQANSPRACLDSERSPFFPPHFPLGSLKLNPLGGDSGGFFYGTGLKRKEPQRVTLRLFYQALRTTFHSEAWPSGPDLNPKKFRPNKLCAGGVWEEEIATQQ